MTEANILTPARLANIQTRSYQQARAEMTKTLSDIVGTDEQQAEARKLVTDSKYTRDDDTYEGIRTLMTSLFDRVRTLKEIEEKISTEESQ